MKQKEQNTNEYTAERALRLLRRELDKERRHSAALEREVAVLKEKIRHGEENAPDGRRGRAQRRKRGNPQVAAREKMREAAARRAHHYRRSSYFRYLFESMMESLPVRIISKLLTYLRHLRVIQIVAAILTAIGTIALVTVVSAALLPFLIVGSIVLSIGAAMRSRHMNRILRRTLEGNHLRVFFPPRGASWAPDSFFMRQARAMAAEEGVAVVIVSPYSISRRGAGKKRFYFTARRDGEDLYVVRRHYFFTFRKRVMDVVDPNVTVIY